MQLVSGLDHAEPARAPLDEEGRDAAVLLVGIGLSEHQGGRGLASVRDEDLAPVQDVAVTVPGGASVLIARVRAGFGLGEREAPELLAGGERREEPLLLRLGAVRLDGVAEQRVVHRHDDRVRRAGLGDFFEREHVGDGVATAAAIALGRCDPHQAELAHPSDRLGGKTSPLVDGRGDRTDLLVRELPRHRLDHLLLVAQLEVHRVTSISSTNVSRSRSFPSSARFYFSSSFLNSAVRSGATSKRSPTIP